MGAVHIRMEGERADAERVLRAGGNLVRHIQALAASVAQRCRDARFASRERSILLKDVPTIMESGFPNFDITGAMGIFAPAATPKDAIDRLSAEIMRTVQLPEVKSGMLRDGFVVAPMGPVEYGAFIRDKFQQIQKIGKAANIKLD